MFLFLENYKGAPAVINFPMRVTFTVASLDIASSSCILDNGAKLRVPKHVKAGDRVIVDTKTREYVSKE